MNLDDLDWQVRHYGGVSPRVVNALLRHGYVEELARAAVHRPDWFCARAAAEQLGAVGGSERAWAVLEPFVRAGWAPALEPAVDALVACGRSCEALGLTAPDGTADGDRAHARALLRAGRPDEAFELLSPHLAAGRLLPALAELTAGQGLDERVLAVLAPLAEEFRRTGGGSRHGWRVLVVQAEVLERAGRAEEAIARLGADVAARRHGPENTATRYAELLARHGRLDELHRLATGPGRFAALEVHVRALVAAGRAAEAEALLRAGVDSGRHLPLHRGLLMDLLARQGRPAEAVAVAACTFESAGDNLLQDAVLLLAELGHQEWALRLLAERSPEFAAENAHWMPSNRWWLLGELGRGREALAEVGTADLDPVERACTVVALLTADDRFEEAIALIPSCTDRTAEAAGTVAVRLIERGRPVEALALIPDLTAQRAESDRRWAAWRGSDAL
ncbi:hypothetical protein [Streptomyces sp. TLI_171]|uniref:hypothetical protein n=1 Tax=Streptomyces sp. TLI_171 TaxID=1938859 RepID=UPI000C404CF1|nr:hypothetical protein [Streptomyces sp. TLI_171]RKE17033.1 hypothetical protein BX266_0284 [Streptomyces sp. TLI_171]